MKFTAALILSLIGISAAIPVYPVGFNDDNQDVFIRNPITDAIEQVILELLESLRDLLINGSEDIPILDPLNIRHVEVDFADIGLPGSHLIIEDAVLNNLSTFVIDNLDISTFLLVRYTMVLDGNIPSLDLQADFYDINLSVLGFTFWGQGDARLSLIAPRIHGHVEVGTRVDGGLFLNINECDLRFTLQGFKSDIKGLLGDEGASDFLNAVFEYLIPDLIEFFEDDIAYALSTIVMEVGNEILADIDVTDIFGRQNLPLLNIPEMN